MKFIISIGEGIKIIRKSQFFTQVYVSKQTGLSRSFLSELENNQKNLTIDTLVKLSCVLNFYPSEMFFFIENPNRTIPYYFNESIKKAQKYYELIKKSKT